jgi:hypothetical protein
MTEKEYQLRHVRPFVRMEQLGLHWTDFHEIWFLSSFRKSVVGIKIFIKIQV